MAYPYQYPQDVHSNPPTPSDPFPSWANLAIEHTHSQDSPLTATPIPTPQAFSTIPLDDPQMIAAQLPSQLDQHSTIYLHHPLQSTAPPHYRPHTLEQTPLPSQAPSPAPVIAPAPAPNRPTTRGVVRNTTTRAGRAQSQAHPYARPATATTSAHPSPAPSDAPAATAKSSKTRKSSVRFTLSTKSVDAVNPAGAATSPTVPSPAPRTGAYASSKVASTSSPGPEPSKKAAPSPSTGPHTAPSTPNEETHVSSATADHKSPLDQIVLRPRGRTYTIPADMQYSMDSNILTASLEVPGIKRQNLHLTLSTCFFNHIKFLYVAAESQPVFFTPPAPPLIPPGLAALWEDRGRGKGKDEEESLQATTSTSTSDNRHAMDVDDQPPARRSIGQPLSRDQTNVNVRERRFGFWKRIIMVPSSTTPQDINAELQDGVLTLKIYMGKPYEIDNDVEIPVH